jgi:hypothetical protein
MKSVKFALMGVALAAAGASNAAVTTYTDQAAWNAAAGAVTVEDFTDTTLVPGLTLSTTNGSIDVGGFFHDGAFTYTSSASDTTFSFGTSVNALSGFWDLLPNGIGSGISLTTSAGDVVVLTNDYFANTFYGFTTTSAFTSFTINALAVDPRLETYNLDNLAFNNAAAVVPEPETYAMMLAGLAAVGFMARRRKIS